MSGNVNFSLADELFYHKVYGKRINDSFVNDCFIFYLTLALKTTENSCVFAVLSACSFCF